ncbi:MAG: SUMF1/EgtB/PvdO family nonheme iron enzyme [Bacteroidota bacterium]
MRLGLIVLISFVFGLNNYNVLANNVHISNVSVTEKNTVEHWMNIKFDLSGENFWRITGNAQNWNAVWIFVKYRVNGGDWSHCSLSTSSVDHIMPIGIVADATSDGMGVFIYSDNENIGNFNLNATNLNLRWNYGIDGVADDASNIEVRVFGIEMVYIPQGSFSVGSGGAEMNAFFENIAISEFEIFSEAEITVAPGLGRLYYDNLNGRGGDRNGPIPAGFPKGFDAFYTMRYEISQEQYVDFLNLLTRDQQNARTNSDVAGTTVTNIYVMSNSSTLQNRNGIRCNSSGLGTTEPINFYCDLNENSTGNEIDDGQNIACGYLNWGDGMAYLDWAGLRPMTELEFEKACRGTNASIGNEFAWGTLDLTQSSSSINNEGEENEQTSNSGNGLCNFDNDGFGPMRCGFSATGTTNRVQAGASYYGLLEMSGNLSERCVTVGSPAGRSFTGENGDGVLTSAGDADVLNWSGVLSQSVRGGNYRRGSDRLRVSSREYAYLDVDDRYENVGWRGVRTVQ